MFSSKNTTFVVINPQVEFLKPRGAGYGPTKDILRKCHTTEDPTELLKHTKVKGYKILILPHYFYDHDQDWKFGGRGGQMMLDDKMFHREHQYQETVKGSGADFVEEPKPYLDENTIITSPHKIFDPESNDLALQLRKNDIDTVILAGMNASLCVGSHLHKLMESGFHIHATADAVGAPDRETYDAAIINFGFVADRTTSAVRILEEP